MLFHNISQYLVVVEVETCAATASQAALITTTPSGGTTTVFTTTGTNIVPGPVVLDGFTFSGTPDVQYGNTNYGLAANGIWARNNVPFSWIAGGGDTGTLTIDLSGSFSAVGLFMNYALNLGGPNDGLPPGTAPTITARDASMAVIESHNIFASAPISTPFATDAGAFRGIETGVNNIAYLQFGGAFSVAHSITLTSVPEAAPEPATLAVFGLGLVGLGLARRKRR